MGYIMNLRKYVGHEPLIGLGAIKPAEKPKRRIRRTKSAKEN